ncbi:hypothetical protein GCM10010272_54160 [Streptomyces lateritius]|nr:hypothetical protein GCM10010272_54160 [Streptomyces lateritius]
MCVLCRQAEATQADHWPLSKRELQTRGLDEHDPRRGSRQSDASIPNGSQMVSPCSRGSWFRAAAEVSVPRFPDREKRVRSGKAATRRVQWSRVIPRTVRCLTPARTMPRVCSAASSSAVYVSAYGAVQSSRSPLSQCRCLASRSPYPHAGAWGYEGSVTSEGREPITVRLFKGPTRDCSGRACRTSCGARGGAAAHRSGGRQVAAFSRSCGEQPDGQGGCAITAGVCIAGGHDPKGLLEVMPGRPIWSSAVSFGLVTSLN